MNRFCKHLIKTALLTFAIRYMCTYIQIGNSADGGIALFASCMAASFFVLLSDK